MAKMTKAQARRRLREIESKMMRLLVAGYCSVKEAETVKKIVAYRIKNTRR